MPSARSHSAWVTSCSSCRPARSAACTRYSRGTSMVMSCSPGATSGRDAPAVLAVGAQPPGFAALDAAPRARRQVVDHDQHGRGAARRRTRATNPSTRVGTGTRVPAGGVRGHEVGLGRELARPRARRSRPGRRRRARHAHLHPAAAAPLDDPEREVVEQLVGEHHAVERHRGEVVERGDDRAHAGDRQRRVLVGRAPPDRARPRTARR